MGNNDQHRLEVILEDINGKFDLVLEGHDALRKEIRDTRDLLGEKIDLNASLIKTSHDNLSARLDAVGSELGKKVDDHEDRIQHLEHKAA